MSLLSLAALGHCPYSRSAGTRGRFLGVTSRRLSAACWPPSSFRRRLPSGACLSRAVGISPGRRGSWAPEAQALPCDTRLWLSSFRPFTHLPPNPPPKSQPWPGAGEATALPGCPELPWGLSADTVTTAAVYWLLAASRPVVCTSCGFSPNPTERRVGVLQPQIQPTPWRLIF